MALIVDLEDVVGELDVLPSGWVAYLNRDTGEILAFDGDDADSAEAGPDDAGLPEWQRNQLAQLRQVLASDAWIPLPTSFDIHEWAIMEAFSRSTPDPVVSDRLLAAIHRSGAFRSFKNALRRYGLSADWQRYRHDAIAGIAAAWLESRGIAYTCGEGVPSSSVGAQPWHPTDSPRRD